MTRYSHARHLAHRWRSRAVSLTTLVLLTFGLVLGFADQAKAGLRGENLILVVNGQSKDSWTVANHYAQLRDIPSGNVIVLNDVPKGFVISLDDFRERILKPILVTINDRKLAAQVSVIAYSVDFPTSVRINEHTERLTDENQKKLQRPVASLNGLTYLYRFVMADNPGYLGWTSNLYARGNFERHFVNPFAGEKAEAYEEAKDLLDDDRPAEAADKYMELAKEYPTVSSLSVLAAEAFAKAGDEASAKQALVLALRGGWQSATYLRDTEVLAPLVDRPPLKAAVDRLSDLPATAQGAFGFGANLGWTSCGHPVTVKQGGMPYLLSCMLGIKADRGSTVEQVVEVLNRSVAADLTRPDGVFGYSKTGDVRTKTRLPGVPTALGRLLAQGLTPEIFTSPLPKHSKDYVGLMLGTATMNLRDRKFNIVPGAICESLTSTGAVFTSDAQTKCTELLHAGAAISSGTVTEPFSLQFKFPLPVMHSYYAEGCTAIEAYYLSVTSPYQLLIVGDPLCQPFARPPSETVDIRASKAERTTVSIRSTTSSLIADPVKAARLEIFAEGQLKKIAAAGRELKLRMPENASGAVDLRVALVAPGPLQSRVSFTQSVELNGPLETPAMEIAETRADEVIVSVSCPGADAIEVQHLGKVIGRVDGASGPLTIRREQRGDGPLRLRPVGIVAEDRVFGQTIVTGS